MKNLFLIIPATMFFSNANAQLSKGSSMIGGNLNYNQNQSSNESGTTTKETRGYKSSGFVIGPNYGYMVTDHIMAGILASYSNSSYTYETKIKTNGYNSNQAYLTESNGFSAGVFSRYYQAIGKSRLAAFAQLNALYGGRKDRYTNTLVSNGVSNETTSRADDISFSANINLGLVYFITNRLAFETTFGNIGYSSSSTKNYDNKLPDTDSKRKNSGFSVAFNPPTLFFGLSYYFGGKKVEPAPTQQ